MMSKVEFELKVNGEPLALQSYYADSEMYQYERIEVLVARFELSEATELLVSHESGGQLEVYSGVTDGLEQSDGQTRFSMSEAGQVVLIGEGLPSLFIFADPADRWAKPDDAVDALEQGIEANGSELRCGAINSAMAELSAAGGGTLYLPAGVYPVATVNMQDNVTLHLEEGAKLEATTDVDAYPMDPDGVLYEDLPTSLIPGPRRRVIYWHDCENAALVGRGVVDGQGSIHRHMANAAGGTRPLINLMKFVNAKNCRVEGVTLMNTEFWNTHVLLSEDITFDFAKVLNERPPHGWAVGYLGERAKSWFWNNTDGINPDSSQRVEIKNSFLYTGDDCVAVKNTGTYKNELRDVRDIHVHDNLMFSGTTPMKIGTETRGGSIENVHFENNVLARCSRVFAAELKDGVTVRNLTVENIKVGECNRPFDLEIIPRQDEEDQKLWSNLDGAVLRNIEIERYRNEGQYYECHIRGRDAEHMIQNVLLENLRFEGKLLESLEDPDLVTNEHISNVSVSAGELCSAQT